MHTGEGWRLGHRPALDGVRGVAILGVLVAHGWWPTDWNRAGHLGVAVFFTLSGYLITSLLASEHSRTGRVDLLAFFGRRIRRLLPAQYVMLAVVTPLALTAGWLYLVPDAAWRAWVYAANTNPYGAIRHLWSLAVEEQFYATWAPLLALLLAVRVRRRVLITGVLLAAGGSLAWRIVAPSELLPARADALLLGAALALALRGRSVPSRLWWLGLAGLVVMALLPTGFVTTHGITVAGALTCFLIATAGHATSGPLTWSWLTWLGRRSYGLYLWHFPIGYFADAAGADPSTWRFAVTAVPLTLLATAVSWRYVEQPFLRRSVRPVEAPGLLGDTGWVDATGAGAEGVAAPR